MNELSTSVDVDAPPDVVWDVLTDFDAYGEWNPFALVAGRPTEGARVTVELRPPGKRATTFRPTVTRVDPGRELRWRGRLFVRGLYDGEHRFGLEALDGGRTRFTQSETFEGLLVGPVNRWVGEATREGFEAMNESLRARAEARAGASAGGAEAATESATGSERRAGGAGDDAAV